MKKVLVVALLSLFWLEPVAANTEEICAASRTAAASIMAARQASIDKSRLLQVVSRERNDQARYIARGLVDAAYMEPRHNTPRERSAAEERFANLTYSICMKELN